MDHMYSLLLNTAPYFALSAFLTWIMIRVKILDIPLDRSSHRIPTPRAGGVAIVISILAWSFLNPSYFHPMNSVLNVPLLALALIIISLMGFWDDVRHLSFRFKLLIQIIAAVMAVQANCFIDSIELPHVGLINLGFTGKFLSFMWIMFFMNMLNFLDGLNGLCAGNVLVMCLFIAFIGWLMGTPPAQSISLFFLVLASIVLGFFLFNYPRPHIFLGDIGSQSLGFLVGSISLFMRDYTGISIFTVPILLFAPIHDIVFTTGFRFIVGENIWLPHKKFLFHRLNRLGYSHSRVTAGYLIFAFIQGCGALLLLQVPNDLHLYIVIPYLIIMSLFTISVTQSIRQHAHKVFFKIKRGKYHPRRKKTQNNS